MVIERDSLDCFINTPSKVHTVNVVFPAEDFETQLECEYKQPRYRHIIVISWVIIDAVPQLFHSIFIFKEKYTWSMFKPQRNSLFFIVSIMFYSFQASTKDILDWINHDQHTHTQTNTNHWNIIYGEVWLMNINKINMIQTNLPTYIHI